MKSSKVVSHIFNTLVIAALFSGIQSAVTFATWASGIMTVILCISAFMPFSKELAEEIISGPILLALSVLASLGIIGGLIYSGSPVWAAVYMTAIITIRAKAYGKLKELADAAP